MGDLTDIIRIASRRPLKDAAFFIAFNIRIGRIEEAVLDVLKISYPEAPDTEINEAVVASKRLAAYCLAIPRYRLNDRDRVRSVLEKAKDDNPGFMPETYLLLEGYARGGEDNVPQAEQKPERFGIDGNALAIFQWITAVLAAIFSYFASAFFLAYFLLELGPPPNLTVASILSLIIFFSPLFIASVLGGISAPNTQAGLASIVFPLATFLLFSLVVGRNAHGFELVFLIYAGVTCTIAALCLDLRKRWRRSRIDRAKREPKASAI